MVTDVRWFSHLFAGKKILIVTRFLSSTANFIGRFCLYTTKKQAILSTSQSMYVGRGRTFRVAQMGRCGEDQQSPRAASYGSLELEIESTPKCVFSGVNVENS